jgi:hypothetical protein
MPKYWGACERDEFMLIEIEVTLEQYGQIEVLAKQQGFEAPIDYVRSLIETDAKVHGQSLALDEDDPIQGFREGWRDAMIGNTYPASTLWDME